MYAYYLKYKNPQILKRLVMKNKLIATMLVLSVQVNGAELDQIKDISDNFCQFHMETESKEDSSELNELVNKLEEYYQSESKKSQVFEDLNSVLIEMKEYLSLKI